MVEENFDITNLLVFLAITFFLAKLRGLKPPLSQVKVEKKDKKF